MDLPQISAGTRELAATPGPSRKECPLAVLVLGMHRSGTSAASGMLDLLGVPVPGRQEPADQANVRGYFENQRIVAFNDRLLEKLGSRWDDPLPLKGESFLLPPVRLAAQELAQLLEAEFEDRPAVLVKDPRICRLLPIWLEALGRVERRVAAILPLRHPLEVAASLRNRDGLSAPHAFSLWLQHVLSAERESRGLPRSFLGFEELLADWRAVAARIGANLGLDLASGGEDKGGEIDAFISAGLRREIAAREEGDDEDPLYGFCLRAWKALAEPAAETAKRKVLDAIKGEFEAALGFCRPLLLTLDRERVRLREEGLARAENFEAQVEALAEDAEAEIAERERQLRREAEMAQRRWQRARGEEMMRLLETAESRRENEVALLRGRLDAVLSSTIWRATAPIRFLGRRLAPSLRRLSRGLLSHTGRAFGLLPARGSGRGPAVIETEAGAAAMGRIDEGAARAFGRDCESPARLERHPLLQAMTEPTILKAIARLERFPPFESSDYRTLYPDVAAGQWAPSQHFIRFGAFEDRQCSRPEHVARVLAELAGERGREADKAEKDRRRFESEAEIAGLASRSPPIAIYVSSQNNIFMKEIAEDMAADLESLGVAVGLRDENSSIEDRAPLSLFLAVDEFFLSGRGREWIRDDVIATSFMVGVEQIQEQWFASYLPLLLMSRGAIDICPQIATLLGTTGLPSFHFVPAPRAGARALTAADRSHPLFRVLPAKAKTDPEFRTPFLERPLDISFFGTATERRDRFFARNAAFLSAYDACIHLRRPERGPIKSEEGAFTRLARHICGQSKIMLNLHLQELPYFEWHRMVHLGMASGSVVVSEPCLPSRDFIPGVHYLEERARHIPDLVEWLIESEEGRREAERIRGNVGALLFDVSRGRQNAARLLEFLLEHSPA